MLPMHRLTPPPLIIDGGPDNSDNEDNISQCQPSLYQPYQVTPNQLPPVSTIDEHLKLEEEIKLLSGIVVTITERTRSMELSINELTALLVSANGLAFVVSQYVLLIIILYGL